MYDVGMLNYEAGKEDESFMAFNDMSRLLEENEFQYFKNCRAKNLDNMVDAYFKVTDNVFFRKAHHNNWKTLGKDVSKEQAKAEFLDVLALVSFKQYNDHSRSYDNKPTKDENVKSALAFILVHNNYSDDKSLIKNTAVRIFEKYDKLKNGFFIPRKVIIGALIYGVVVFILNFIYFYCYFSLVL